MFPGPVFLPPKLDQCPLHRVLARVWGLTLDKRVPGLAQRYRRAPVPNRMVKFDVGAEFVAGGEAVVERFAAQFASVSTEEVSIHCCLLGNDPLLERVKAKTEDPERSRQECGYFSWHWITVQKVSHRAGRRGKGDRLLCQQ